MPPTITSMIDSSTIKIKIDQLSSTFAIFEIVDG